MFGSNILEVVIGLVFIFLLYSLLATTIKEGIAATFSLRGKMLEKAIRRMLDDGLFEPHTLGESLRIRLWKLRNYVVHRLSYVVPAAKKWEKDTDRYLVKKFYDHPAIKYLGENRWHRRPGYISPGYFSRALIDILRTQGAAARNDDGRNSQQLPELPDPKDATAAGKMAYVMELVGEGIRNIDSLDETKKLLQSYYEEAGHDVGKFKERIEQWFNETMDRASGWYKRQAQRIIFVIGLVIAIVFNVDTISIVKKLSKDKDARRQLADLAAASYQSADAKYGKDSLRPDSVRSDSFFVKTRELLKSDIADANTLIGLGWYIPASADTSLHPQKASEFGNDKVYCKTCLKKVTCGSKAAELNYWQKSRYVLCMATSSGRKLLGYCITALAISFGAPFWFDLLSKLMQLRGAGKKPDQKE